MQITTTVNNDQIKRELGQRIQDSRIAQNLTRSDLSVQSGLSTSTIARLEGGVNIGFDALCDVLRALGYLDNIQLLVPEQELKPTQLLLRQDKRKRASRKSVKKPVNQWVWGEDK